MSNKMSKISDEDLYADFWRINSKNCDISEKEKKKVIFLPPEQSYNLWRDNISEDFNHLMKIPSEHIDVRAEVKIDFSLKETGENFFKKELKFFSLLIFFWGAKSACIVPKNIFIANWSDFFYPSDESSIIFIPNSRKKIFSYEEKFFVATLQSGRDSQSEVQHIHR
jgi:hypothetical protein